MKKSILIPLTAFVALASCNKEETPRITPFSYELVNAKINLGATRSTGPIGCIELNDNGSFYAEVLAGEDHYDGLEKYLQIPFERILVGTQDRKAASYVSGTYTAGTGEYRLEGLGTLSFEQDMLFAQYTYTDGKSYRDRTGITPKPKQPLFKPANGQWTPCKADITVNNLADDTRFEGSYDTLDFEKIAADIAASCAPALESYLPLFEGYRLTRMNVSQLNTFVMEYTNGKRMGGYWKFESTQGTVNKLLDNQHVLTTTLAFTPTLDGNKITLVIEGEISVNNLPAYLIEARIELVG